MECFYLSHDKKTPTDTRPVGVELVSGPENHWKFLYLTAPTPYGVGFLAAIL